MRARRACPWLWLWLACAPACSDTIDVFAVTPRAVRDAGATRDAQTTNVGCEPCGVDRLCAIDHCIDARGNTALGSWLAHSCSVERGQLFCWGANDRGQLGQGDMQAHGMRVRVGSFNDWLAVATGEQHTCALRAPGKLYCFGGNSSGELALGDTAARLEPVQVGAQKDWSTLACGGKSCCGLHAGGVLECWGDNSEGKAGQNDESGAPDATEPLRVSPAAVFRDVAVGQGHVCAIRADGALYCWGRNTDLELGIGSANPMQVRPPRRIGSATNWQSIAASQHHTCGLRDDGGLWCWGSNAFFELGREGAAAAAPERVGSDADWASVAVGWFHSCAIKRDGRLFCWGRAIEGQLAQGSNVLDPIATPSLVHPPEHWRHVALGNFMTCAIDDQAALYCFGENTHGELGLADPMRRYVPAAVP